MPSLSLRASAVVATGLAATIGLFLGTKGPLRDAGVPSGPGEHESRVPVMDK
jgi:hypothetical protein